MTKKTFYVTTAIDYVNSEPHLGHAYQKIIADVLARWYKVRGADVFFLTGTDEHGQKLVESAEKEGKTPKQFVDSMSKKFEKAWKEFNLSFDRFIRTTDEDHKKKVKEFTKILKKNGDIYKGEYRGLYCQGCEAYVTEKDLVNGRCPFHPNKELKEISEEAYFFKLSNYQKDLLKLYEKNSDYILPKFRRQEIINRVKEGLRDLCISRNKNSLSWGIELPFDKEHVTYVWYEALQNYITGIDWPNKKFKKFWPADVQLLGIDNGWFHCVIWPAILIAAGIEPPKTILINGFLTFNGQKISKSLANSISPITLKEKYGVDSVRYYLARNFVFGQDGDFSEAELIARHNNELLNKLGNLVSRVAGLIEKNGLEKTENKLIKKLKVKEIEKKFENYEFDKVLNLIFEFVDVCNEYVQNKKPWESKDKKILYELADSIKSISILLWPFIPETCEKIAKEFNFEVGENSYKNLKKDLKISKIKKGKVLFEKIEEKINKPVKINEIMEGVGNVNFEDWTKLDLRVAKIISVEDIEGADKLYKIQLDVGSEIGERIICAGLKEFYPKKDLKGKKIIYFSNLTPRNMRGIESQGMLLAATTSNHKKVVLLTPEKDIEVGARVS